ncbi:MAG: hypothetical protein ABIA37_00995 [Candidatus Woesearchaeota archaeon]
MKSAIIILALTLLLLTACVYEQQEKEDVTSEPEQVVETTPTPTTGQVEVVKTVPTMPAAPQYAPEVKALLDKTKDITSFYYVFEGRKLNVNGNYEPRATYEAYYKEGKAKKVLSKAVKLQSAVYYNEVYLDDVKETAIGLCTKTSITCEDNLNKAYTLIYDEHDLEVTPLDLISEIPADAKRTEERFVNNRKATAIEYKENGNNVRMYLDNFYGIPLKKVIYTHEDDMELVLEDAVFNKIGENSVRTSEVTLPAEYTVVE